jgi:hypothetical protein
MPLQTLTVPLPRLGINLGHLTFHSPRQCFNQTFLEYCSRYSDWLQVGRLRGWSSSPGGSKNFHFFVSSSVAQRSIQWAQKTLSQEVKRPGRESQNSTPPSAEVKKMWVYTSTPPIRLHGAVHSYAQGQLYV